MKIDPDQFINIKMIYDNVGGEIFDVVSKLSNFSEITLRHGCSPVNFLRILRTPFPKNTSGGLLMKISPVSKSSMSLPPDAASLVEQLKRVYL